MKLSTIYNVISGDTFENIARKEYGNELEANRIAQANPGVFEPLVPGTTLTIPSLPDAPQNLQQQSVADNQNETAILIDGKRFRFWDTIRIIRSIDSMDTLEFSAPFDSDAPDFRNIFKPFSYKTVVITVGGNPLFTGTMVAINPNLENNRKIVTVSGYSLPGVLNDCTPPASASQLEQLEFKGQGLRDIAKKLASPFGISVVFEVNQGAIFEPRVAIESGKRVLSFLIKLAKQRNLIVSNTLPGELLFQKSVDVGKPVARLQQGESPVLSVIPSFNPQKYYSHITGIEPESIGTSGNAFTVKNSRLEGVVRPFTFDVPDTIDADVKEAVQAKIGRMFGNIASYSVSLTTWRDPSGNLWEPNTTVKILAPGAMVYNEYEFIIRSVEFNRNQNTETTLLNLIIPGSFSGEIPEVLPWD